MMNGETHRFISDPDDPSTWQKVPSRLLVPGDNPTIPTPPETRPQLLPLHDLAWEDFERLCLRLLELEMETVHVEEVNRIGDITGTESRMYGQRGQAQYGIDMYARDRIRLGEIPPERRYVCLQARRIESVSETTLRTAVTDFVVNKWSSVARKFIYATSCSGIKTQFVDELERQTQELAKSSIELTVWDQEKISQLLRDRPRIVDDFFGREWVTIFCGSSQADSLCHRLDANKVSKLRRSLARIYGASFHIADSGQLVLGSARSIRVQDRFVTPDVISTTHEGAIEPVVSDDFVEEVDCDSLYDISSQDLVLSRSEFEEDRIPLGIEQRRQLTARRMNSEERLSAEAWLGTTLQQVIVGDPGAGKSTLLRYMIMDLLSDRPLWRMVAERWGDRLPVWLPFHYFTQRVAGNTGQPASISAAIKAWLEQYDFGDVWPLIEEALSDERLLLVVDGLDEWVSDEAGRIAAAALETFTMAHSAAIVVTTRPYGLTRLTLGAGWDFARVAPLTREQQRELAQIYFATTVSGREGEDASNTVNGLVGNFLTEIRSSSDLRIVSGIPLFMILLIGLRLSTTGRLPERRFEVYDRAVELLLSDHPARRRVAAAVTATNTCLSEHEARTILAEVAYLSQKRGEVKTISEKVIRDDLRVILSSPDHFGTDAISVHSITNDILDIAEGELGLLVRNGPAEFSFLHRMIQEQLAAEHIADRLEESEIIKLFNEYVGEPSWREVLLATIWRITRPTELRHIVEVIENKVNEMPVGLQAREFLTEMVFGQYGLPGDAIKRLTPILIEVADTHSYGTHRLRLMNAIFSGLNNATTRNVIEECIGCWAVLADRPTANLVLSVAQLPADDRISMNIVRFLLLAISKPDISIAFSAAVSIVKRCTNEGSASTLERKCLKKGLLDLLADPPSGICQSAALAALALYWREDPVINSALHEAKSHSDARVRLVALADAIGVLSASLIGEYSITSSAEPLQESERNWLLNRLENTRNFEMHQGLLITTIAQAVKGNLADLEYLLKKMKKRMGMEQGLIWGVALKAFSDDERVIDSVCELLRSEKYYFPLRTMMGLNEGLLVYAPPSQHNNTIAQAIEDHLGKFGGEHLTNELFNLATIDRGPIMKNLLLNNLKTTAFPHWISAALIQYYPQEEDVKLALQEVLLGDAILASKVANAAVAVLPADMVVQRLLDILGEIYNRTKERGRPDIVVHALIEACKANGLMSGDMGEAIASQAIDLIPGHNDIFFNNPKYDLSVAFYPTHAAKNALDALAKEKGHLIIPFLEAYRKEPDIVMPFLGEAMQIIKSPPAQMRIRLCQLLSERSISPDFVIAATERWADEVSERNKSYASLAYHRALLEAKNEGFISDEKWEQAKLKLGQTASCYGPDHEARRRAAWVGMCVLGDWSMIDGLVERIGEQSPVAVSLSDEWEAPDIVLLHQIAGHWQDLREYFGSGLLGRLAGKQDRNSLRKIWGALSIVAARYPEIEKELEAAVEREPELLKEDPILFWFMSRPKWNQETAADALVASLTNAGSNVRGLTDIMIAELNHIGMDRNVLRNRLESIVEADPCKGDFGNRLLEALALAFPDHELVKTAWIKINEALKKNKGERRSLLLHPQTYIAVAYSEISSKEVLKQLQRHLTWMRRTDETMYDEALTRHLSSRLKRDGDAALIIADAILTPETPDEEAAVLASLLSASVPLSKEILDNLGRRLEAQIKAKLAPVVQDRVLSVSMSARNLLTKVIESGR